ncbi:hypothetical protein OGAPHI_002685 [Ogataea philodendri]|uniref:Signal peptidase subunit 3 n=1 Tax=Ogataea philodendri TaxID=1378263 RepID=A0A9P8T881_9ASCO|nr:uncharacterized protein OGAPHI_002685 [Ogataea philodendri]KAH3668930.1 hypothetical protein OGAPHI_002685 [Ogataea philodendri]
MFSLFQRAQTVSNYVLTLVTTMAAVISLSWLLQLHFSAHGEIPATIAINKAVNTMKYSRNFGGRPNAGKENVRVAFDLNADLSSLFNWNTKQVFVYLVADYEGKDSQESKVVFWDKIVETKQDAVLDLTDIRSKYSVWDYSPTLHNKTATFKLEYNIQPYVGPLIWGTADASTQLQFPEI